MLREQEPSFKKTSYEAIKDLYEMPSDQSKTSRILVKGNVKTFVLEDESSIRIERFVHNDKPWFIVSLDNILEYRIDKKEGLVVGYIERLRLPNIQLELGSFSMQVELSSPSDLILVPKEHGREVEEILVGWTQKSIEEGKLGSSPFKLNFRPPNKQVK